MSSRNQVLTNNVNSFPNNNSGQITPQVLRDFNADFINSTVFLDQTSSMAVASASYATTASFLQGTIASASYALTASYALNAGGGGGGSVDTGSLLNNASAVNATTTFTRGNGTTFDVTVDNVANATSASFASTAATAASANTATSASFATNAATAANATSASFASSASYTPNAIVTASVNVSTITFTKGNGSQFSLTIAQSGSVATASYAIFAESASNAANANLLDGLDSTAFVLTSQTSSMSVLSASFASNANSASYALSASQAQNAVSASFAASIPSGLNISASNITVANNLVVNGTASFAYTVTTTGSAVVIGDEFIILNADTPRAPYAGIKVYDTGSNSTASLEWNGNGDYWIAVEEGGQSAAVLTGATGSKGSEVFPSVNTLVKGTGNQQLVDSKITDNGTLVSIASNTAVNGNLVVNASNSFTASGLNYPTADGAYSGQVLQTNAAGTLSFGNVAALYQPVKNGEATSLTVGTAVYVSGSQGANPTVYRADASNPAKMPVSFIISETITAGATGRALVLGVLEGYNVGAAAAGTAFYVDGNGTLTTIRPTGSADIVQPIAIVTKTGVGGQLSVLNPGPVLLPNLQTGYTWIGNGSNQPIAVSTASLLVTSSSYATTASFAETAVSASYAPSSPAFPFTGSAGISGSLALNGDQYLTGSLSMTPSFSISGSLSIIEANDGTGFEGNIISVRNNSNVQSGSFVVSGSNNLLLLSSGGNNDIVAGGAAVGFQGRTSIVTAGAIQITGSLGTGYSRLLPTLISTVANGNITVTDNRPVGTTTSPLTSQQANLNGNLSFTISTGSFSLNQSNLVGSLSVAITGSNGNAKNATGNVVGGLTITADSTSGGMLSSTVAVGNSISVYVSGSSNAIVTGGLIVGNTLIVTGSAAGTAQGSAFVGRYNATGSVNLVGQTVFAVGTGTGTSARRTSMHVSASGLTTISTGLTVSGSFNVVNGVTGSLLGTASFADNATSASYALVATSASFATTASYWSGSITNALSASFATTASYALNAGSGGVQGSEIYSYTFLTMGA